MPSRLTFEHGPRLGTRTPARSSGARQQTRSWSLLPDTASVSLTQVTSFVACRGGSSGRGLGAAPSNRTPWWYESSIRAASPPRRSMGWRVIRAGAAQLALASGLLPPGSMRPSEADSLIRRGRRSRPTPVLRGRGIQRGSVPRVPGEPPEPIRKGHWRSGHLAPC